MCLWYKKRAYMLLRAIKGTCKPGRTQQGMYAPLCWNIIPLLPFFLFPKVASFLMATAEIIFSKSIAQCSFFVQSILSNEKIIVNNTNNSTSSVHLQFFIQRFPVLTKVCKYQPHISKNRAKMKKNQFQLET